jgi:hypothetical protein
MQPIYHQCIYCGGDSSECGHLPYCDGRQGHAEAEKPDDDDLDLRGMVHADDPYTSVEAAVSVAPHLNVLQERIKAAFHESGPLSDERLERLPQFAEYGQTTISKRRTELFQRGLLVPVGDEINSRGRRMLVWALRDECVEIEPGQFQYVGRSSLCSQGD